jgi:hypothetical protein
LLKEYATGLVPPVINPVPRIVPFTSRGNEGDTVPTPRFPVPVRRINSDEAVEDVAANHAYLVVVLST